MRRVVRREYKIEFRSIRDVSQRSGCANINERVCKRVKVFDVRLNLFLNNSGIERSIVALADERVPVGTPGVPVGNVAHAERKARAVSWRPYCELKIIIRVVNVF